MSVIEDITSVPPEEKIDRTIDLSTQTPTPCLLHIHHALNDREKTAIALAVRNYIGELSTPAATIRPLSTGSMIIDAILTPAEMLEVGREFNAVRHITPNRLFFITDGMALGRVPPNVEVGPVQSDIAVAVCDSGIASSSPFLASAVIRTLVHLPPGATAPELEHGTFVASRVLYGDGLEEGIRLGRLVPACRLVDIQLLGKFPDGTDAPVTEAHLAQALDTALPQLPSTVRVINASFGTNRPIVDGQYSEVANVLDHHARGRDLVVVTTAGNIRDRALIRRYPSDLTHDSWRIDSPGEAALALTVGSIAHFVHPDAVVGTARSHSPFSRRGPGPDGGLKPELVAHGGNFLRTDPPITNRIGTLGLHADGYQVACDVGTSFAAPLVSRDAALIMAHYENATANLTRALLCHFARPALCPAVGIENIHLVGFGEPDLGACLSPGPHSAAFLHWGTMTPDTFRYIPFFVPASFVSGSAAGTLRVRATIAINPVVNAQSPLEYVQARVSLALRKRQELGFRELNLSDASVETSKWATIKRIEKTFRRGYTSGQWELRMRVWTRDLPEDYTQPYAVVIEVIDDSNSSDVWADIEAEAGAVFRPARRRTAAA